MIEVETKLGYSEIESSVLGLKTARCDAVDFNERELLNQVVSSEYDICRLKIPAEDEMASYKLHKMGLPFSFSGSIRRYKTKITAPLEGHYFHPKLKYELYDGSQDQLLKDMLIDTWGTYPVGYYRSPLLGKLVNKESESEVMFRFYKKQNDYRYNPANSIVFMKDNDEYVGFFALNILNGNLESHTGGILSKYRQSGYFHDMLRYIREYCIEKGLEYFLFGARNENAIVQKAFEKEKFKSIGSENVFHIASLLTYSQIEPIQTDIKIADKQVNTLNDQLLQSATKYLKEYLSLPGHYSFNVKILNPHILGVNRLTITFPLEDEDECLVVLKLYASDNNLSAIGYLNVHFKR